MTHRLTVAIHALRKEVCAVTGLALALLCVPLAVRAERPPQEREKAPIAMTGTVDGVDETWDLQTDYYKIRVRVDGVERGKDIHPSDLFEVSCFRWSRPWPGYVGARGHSMIPDVGDRIHLFAWPRGAGHEGNYPDWFDIIEPSPRPWIIRVSDSRKLRALCLFTAVIAIGIVGWRRRKRLRRPQSQIGMGTSSGVES